MTNGKVAPGGAFVVSVRATNELGTVALQRASARAPARRRSRRRPRKSAAGRVGNLPRCSSASIPVASILSAITDAITSAIGDYGLYAVFAAHARRRRAARRERGHHGLRRRARRGRVRGPAGHALRPDDRRRVARVPRDRARGDDRVHDRRGPRLGDRALRRPTVPRAPRPLVPSERGEARARGALVRPLGRLGGLPRAAHARRALVRLHPGRRVRDRSSAATRCSRSSARRSGASRSRAPGTPPGRAGRTSITRSGTSTTSWRLRSWPRAALLGWRYLRRRRRLAEESAGGR